MKNQYYIVSLKHTSKGDTALTLWGKNFAGYVWQRDNAGIYTDEDMAGCESGGNVFVKKENADPLFMHGIDFQDKYIALPNNTTVRLLLNLDEKFMKLKRYASCRIKFTSPLTTKQ